MPKTKELRPRPLSTFEKARGSNFQGSDAGIPRQVPEFWQREAEDDVRVVSLRDGYPDVESCPEGDEVHLDV